MKGFFLRFAIPQIPHTRGGLQVLKSFKELWDCRIVRLF